jgi:hypothetical protein
VQTCDVSWQESTWVHTPFVQASVEVQQGSVVQDWPVLAHAELLHVPCVAPSGTSHEKPVQQSSLTVHDAPAGAHQSPQRPASHVPEQQSAFPEQTAPSNLHVGHVPLAQDPTQHGSPPVVQASPGATQGPIGRVSAQRQPPSAPR